MSFAVDEGDDYAFDVFKTCLAKPFDGLADEFGPNTPPVTEWTFFYDWAEEDPDANYANDVAWPETVYIRVFRAQNDLACTVYQLQVERIAD